MIYKLWRYCAKWLIIDLIIFDPLISINNNWMQVLHIQSTFVIDMLVLHILAIIIRSKTSSRSNCKIQYPHMKTKSFQI
jgi:hypothetical protein